MDELVLDLEKLATKIITLIEIPEIVRENIFSLIKKSIPLTIWIAIVTKDGLPIIDSNLKDARLSGQLAHMFETSKLLVENKLDSVILNGQEGHIIINEIDENRILAVGILEENKEKVEIYAIKLKEIIKISLSF
jgi:predicted regulator of Ras-like GTPase activity (Roadblock/LC7/MglB family)